MAVETFIYVTCPSECTRIDIDFSRGTSEVVYSGDYSVNVGNIIYNSILNEYFIAEVVCPSNAEFEYWKCGVGSSLSTARSNANRVTSGSSGGLSYDYWGYARNPTEATYASWIDTYHDQGTNTYLYIEPVVSVSRDEIADWDWSISNCGNATARQTSNSYNALYTGSPTTDFHHGVWNDFVDKIYEVLSALGESWQTSYGSMNLTTKSGTYIRSSPYTLTALKYNTLIYNISYCYHCARGRGWAYSDDDIVTAGVTPVEAQMLLDIADRINDCIYWYNLNL